ncbi:MAG: alkaline phosphatase family protein [Candidatus Acidiferrales bacterium]
MSKVRFLCTTGVLAFLVALGSLTASAQQIKTVFVIAMENHNWTQPANQFTGPIQQIYGNPNAPFINSLVNGTAPNDISDQVAYATAYHNVLFGTGAHIHPSEPNYLWAEAGTNFGVANDADPFPSNLQTTSAHLATLLTNAGKTWKSYQEDIDLTLAPPYPAKPAPTTNVPISSADWSVPLVSFSGFFTGPPTNFYNGSLQFNYAAKHNPMVFFTDANGGAPANTAPSNPLSSHYAPLQQLAADLANDNVADYNWISPDQYNDQHTALTGGYKGLTGDAANIKQGDDFLSVVVPMIMASDAYKNHGVIVIWWDESESDGVPGDNADDATHTIGEIVISDRAHPNVNGLPYASPVVYTHSSDLKTWQDIFHAGLPGPGSPYLGDAASPGVNDLSDLFKPGVVPKKP